MYTLVIADDQETIRRGLMNTILKACPEITVSGVFKNGLETLEYLSSHSVDIIIADINMPHKTGLDVARHVYEHRLETKVVLITGYKEFEYAKSALDYQAACLLSKPFATAQLIDCIRGIEAEIERNNRIAFTSAKEYLESWSLRGEILRLLCNGTITMQTALLRGKTFHRDIPLENLSLCEIVFSSTDHIPQISEQEIKGLGEMETEDYSAFAVCTQPQKTVFLLFFSSDTSPDFVCDFARNYLHSVQVLFHCKMTFSYEIFSDMQVYLALRKAEQLEELYFDCLRRKNIEEAKQAVGAICSSIHGVELNRIFVSVTDRLTELFGVESPYKNKNDENPFTDEQIKERFLELTVQAAKNFSEIHYIITQVCDYVKENFGLPEMSLNHVAYTFHINANYLGRVFKRETGERFVDYLVKIRVEKAKVLLQKGNLEVQDIARAVGYNQVKYFRMVFKTHTGMSATQWAKLNRLGRLS